MKKTTYLIGDKRPKEEVQRRQKMKTKRIKGKDHRG
jgi:hypothetical protein